MMVIDLSTTAKELGSTGRPGPRQDVSEQSTDHGPAKPPQSTEPKQPKTPEKNAITPRQLEEGQSDDTAAVAIAVNPTTTLSTSHATAPPTGLAEAAATAQKPGHQNPTVGPCTSVPEDSTSVPGASFTGVTKWWDDLQPWVGLGGIPRTAKFLASDPEMITAIFRRFRETSIRNLLNLEARVAALQALQSKLDDEDREAVGGDDTVFRSLAEGTPGDMLNIQKSWEVFAVLGTAGGRRNTVGLPESVLAAWEDTHAVYNAQPNAPILEGQHGSPATLRMSSDPAREASKTTDVPARGAQTTKSAVSAMGDERIQLRWDLSLAIQEGIKEYQDAIVRHSAMLKFETPARRTWPIITEWYRKREEHDSGVFLDTSAMRWVFQTHTDRRDSMCLYKAGNEDLVTRLITQLMPTMRSHLEPTTWRVTISSESVVTTLSMAITLTVTVLLLVVAVWVMAYMNGDRSYTLVDVLGALTGFVITFALWMTVALGAKRPEAMTATATYAAVLVVFLAQVIEQSSYEY